MDIIREFDQIFDKIYPQQINLRSFDKKDVLCPAIWHDNDMKRIVRKHIIAVTNHFMENIDDNMVIPVKDILLVGSIAGFNWSKYSDIDVHVQVDYDELKEYGTRETLAALFDMKKDDWNSKHDVLIYGYPIEMYIQGIDDKNESDGIYSVKYAKWIHIPSGGNAIVHRDLIKRQAARYINITDKLIDAAEKARSRRQCRALYDELDRIKDEIVKGRRDGLAEEGESAPGNIIFKVLRRTGHIGKIKDAKRMLYDKMNQLS